jgi:hypothetical protein
LCSQHENVSPVHHSQLFKYATPSPAAFPYFLVDAISPFFLTTKLAVLANACLPSWEHLPGTDKETTGDCETDTDDLELRVFGFRCSRC